MTSHPEPQKPDAAEVARKTPWPDCPWCEEDELACLWGPPGHVHADNCLLYCYRCGRQVATASQIEALKARVARGKLLEMAGRMRDSMWSSPGSATTRQGSLADGLREAASMLEAEAKEPPDA